jgi:hypothetical protein
MTQSFPTFQFQNIPVNAVVQEAFDLCGKVSDEVSGYEKQSALNSLNYIFAEWANQGVNLFAIESSVIQLSGGQNIYSMPDGLVDITEMTCSQFQRPLNGVAESSDGGNPENCFNPLATDGCQQIAPNGNISFKYIPLPPPPRPPLYPPVPIPPYSNPPYQIYYVGITAQELSTYTLAIEYSNDNINWNLALQTNPTNYVPGVPTWFYLNTPGIGLWWRVRETGGATLWLNQINFSMPTNSYYMKRISREVYTSVPSKTTTGGLGSWYLDREKVPTLYLWPTPDLSFPYLVFNYMQEIPDVLKFSDTLYVPKRYMKAVSSCLAAEISSKFYKDQFAMLDAKAQRSYLIASTEDAERADMHIGVDLTSYFQ